MSRPANLAAFLSPQFGVLSESELQDLHFAALEVLRRIGMRFHHPAAVEMLREAGAFVSDGNLVKIPAALVQEAIGSAPSRIVMCDRDGAPAFALEGTRVAFGPGSDCPTMIDPATGEHRAWRTGDLIDAYRLVDALPNIDFVMSMGIPSDRDPATTYDVQMALMLEHTTKPIVFVTDDRAACQRAIDMAAAVAGGHEALAEQQHILLYSEPSSPLQHSETAVDKLILMAEHGLPIVYSPGPLMGGTAPITMASGLAMSLAEILSGLVVHQLARPGAPFVFGAGLHHMDMGSAQISYGSPEFQLTKAAIAELGRWYGLPTWGYAGCTDAKVLDEQAALEAMLSVMTARLGGSNLVHDVGYIESGLTTSLDLITLTDELIALSANFMKGIEITPETLMLDELERVGPGGHFLDTPTTFSRFKDFWYPTLLDRRRREAWEADGSLTLGERVNARTRALIAEHRAAPLDDDAYRQVQAILAQAAG